MKSIFKIRTAISLAMCMALAMVCLTGCDKDDGPGGDTRDGYTGTYKVTSERVGTIGTDVDYNITITKSSANTVDILISNIINLGAGYTIVATVNGDSFTIPQQTVVGVGFSGSGRRNGNSISFSVQVTETGYATVNFSVDAVRL